MKLTKTAESIKYITAHDAKVIIKASGHQHQWLAGGYDLEIGHLTGKYIAQWLGGG